jgi:hypothetical protein
MVDDDTLVELWRRLLKDPRTSDAEIRRLSRLALLRYEDFRLQLIAWSLKPTDSSLPNSAAMTSQLQHDEPVPRKDRAVPLECRECRTRYIAVLADDPPDWKPHCIEHAVRPRAGPRRLFLVRSIRLNAPNGMGRAAPQRLACRVDATPPAGREKPQRSTFNIARSNP